MPPPIRAASQTGVAASNVTDDTIAENDLGLVVGEAPAATQRSATESGGTIPDPINIEAKFRADIFKGPFRRTVEGEISELLHHLAAGGLHLGGGFIEAFSRIDDCVHAAEPGEQDAALGCGVVQPRNPALGGLLNRHSKWSAVDGHRTHGSDFYVELQRIIRLEGALIEPPATRGSDPVSSGSNAAAADRRCCRAARRWPVPGAA